MSNSAQLFSRVAGRVQKKAQPLEVTVTLTLSCVKKRFHIQWRMTNIKKNIFLLIIDNTVFDLPRFLLQKNIENPAVKKNRSRSSKHLYH